MDRKELFKSIEGKLFSYKNIDNEIKALELEIEDVKNEYRGCKSIVYEEKVNNSLAKSSSIENEVIAKERKIEHLEYTMRKKEIERKKISNALETLDKQENEFFEYFYLPERKPSFVSISQRMFIDRSQCYRVRDKVVDKFAKMIYPDYEI
ncbi:hypothetical protein [Metaclostridioides mangenotii]|uniref:RinA family phage transcriptional activator n=1 Tax=Metaclostridioides mangenotii TaxID=1540 RepID=A0ABS4E952_9FIRM|nr:hypothetical protein [Clostridioides mangenotii]MBP1854443.1 RinA family phage transcriptional activator [Clostridioides mangenotii]